MNSQSAGAVVHLLFNGLVRRLLQDHHCVQPCTDSGPLCGMLDRVVPAKRRKGQADGGLFFQEEAALKRD